jgi:hypothetical protein
MSNPALLFWDTDALIQVLFTGTHRVFSELKTNYGIRSVVVPEVELEVVSQRQALSKAIRNDVVHVIDSRSFESIIGSDPSLQARAIGKSYVDMQTMGAAYGRSVGSGEAYTHAMAVSLGQPAVSNDWNAITTLDRTRAPLPTPVLRAFDVLVFGHQIGTLSSQDCDAARQALLATGREYLPKCWRNASFDDGLSEFTPRLVDGKAPTLGKRPRVGVPGHEKPLIITRI